MLFFLRGILFQLLFLWQISINPSGSSLEIALSALTLTWKFTHTFRGTDSILDFLQHGNPLFTVNGNHVGIVYTLQGCMVLVQLNLTTSTADARGREQQDLTRLFQSKAMQGDKEPETRRLGNNALGRKPFPLFCYSSIALLCQDITSSKSRLKAPIHHVCQHLVFAQ